MSSVVSPRPSGSRLIPPVALPGIPRPQSMGHLLFRAALLVAGAALMALGVFVLLTGWRPTGSVVADVAMRAARGDLLPFATGVLVAVLVPLVVLAVGGRFAGHPARRALVYNLTVAGAVLVHLFALYAAGNYSTHARALVALADPGVTIARDGAYYVVRPAAGPDGTGALVPSAASPAYLTRAQAARLEHLLVTAPDAALQRLGERLAERDTRALPLSLSLPAREP